MRRLTYTQIIFHSIIRSSLQRSFDLSLISLSLTPGGGHTHPLQMPPMSIYRFYKPSQIDKFNFVSTTNKTNSNRLLQPREQIQIDFSIHSNTILDHSSNFYFCLTKVARQLVTSCALILFLYHVGVDLTILPLNTDLQNPS